MDIFLYTASARSVLGLIGALAISTAFAASPALSNQTVEEIEYIQLAALVDEAKHPRQPLVLPYREAKQSSWALALDNDILAATKRDQDYTYGFNFTYTGSAAKESWLSLDHPLSAVDQLLGIGHLSREGINSHSIEIGMFGFTPEDTKIVVPNLQDRPYASLIYLSSSREQLNLSEQVSWKTTLTLGVLGLGWVGDFQNEIHDILGATEARGWDNQISAGGELTARYSVARQQLLGTLFENTEIKSTLQASIGYLTEASWSLSLRSGNYHTAWSSFNPDLASYGEKSTYNSSASAMRENYFWGGAAVKLRAYNAFLQGQFRNSEVTYGADDLNPVVMEAWLGYTLAFTEGFRISYVVRGHTSEIKTGAGNRNLVWGGIILSKVFP